MPGPWKPYNLGQVGVTTQTLYNFVQQLFGPGGNVIRNTLLAAANETQLRTLLAGYGISLPANIGGPGSPPPPLRIMLVDIQSARCWQDPSLGPINPATDYFYVLVMPPVPTRYSGQPGYEEMQALESAFYHAEVDGYGM
jgi:hypothetical protein